VRAWTPRRGPEHETRVALGFWPGKRNRDMDRCYSCDQPTSKTRREVTSEVRRAGRSVVVLVGAFMLVCPACCGELEGKGEDWTLCRGK
jgi:hypothetical protein